MNREDWQHIVNEARNGNELLFNNAVTSNYGKHFYNVIVDITRDDQLTKEIYIIAMTKFWERFILWGEPLPESNINGYIYTISKNAFFEKNRKANTEKHGFIKSSGNIEILEKYHSHVHQSNSVDIEEIGKDRDESLHQLHLAIQSLDIKCKKIIELNILQNITLAKLKDELGITGTYNAIVQKKKRCLNHLRRLLQKEFQRKSSTIEGITS